MTTIKEHAYIPLALGLGLISPENVAKTWMDYRCCPKIYTTRTHQLKGEYYVVEGSRFKAKPVEPRIEFKAFCVASFTINDVDNYGIEPLMIALRHYENRLDEYTFTELDLGKKGATWDELKHILLRLNKKATGDTIFYTNKLEPICKT